MDVDNLLLRGVAVATLLVFLARFFTCTVLKRETHRLPPGPTTWPIIGAIPLLAKTPHVSLAQMAKKHGPIMYLKMGRRGMVVASSPEAAEMYLKGQDHNLPDRAHYGGSTNMAYNNQTFLFVDYGPKWKLFRSISSHHMLGPEGIEKWARVRDMEVGHMLRAMFQATKIMRPVVVPEFLTYVIANMISQVVFRKRLFADKGRAPDEFRELVLELVTMAEFFYTEDYLPLVAWMDLRGIQVRRKKVQQKFDDLLTRLIKEHVTSVHQRVEPKRLAGYD